MPVISSAAPWSYAKAFIVVALLACSTTGMVAAESMPEDVILSSRALTVLSAAHDNASVKRYLRSNAAITTSDVAVNSEERVSVTPLSGFGATVKGHLSAFVERIRLWWWRLLRLTPDTVYEGLGIRNIEEGKLLQSGKFNTWLNFVKSTNKENPVDAEKLAFDVLVEKSGEDGLAKIVAAGKRNTDTKEYAEKLEKAQMARWMDDRVKYTAASVFESLKLHEAGTKLFESPGIYSWVKFVEKTSENEAIKVNSIFEILDKHYASKDALVKALVEGKKTGTMGDLASELQALQIARWVDNGDLNEETLFQSLKLDPTNPDHFEAPVFFSWVSYLEEKSADLTGTDMKRMIEIIVQRCNNDVALSRVLAEGKKTEYTKNMAEKLEKAQLAFWQNNPEKYNTESLYALLMSNNNKPLTSPFHSPMFESWIAFVRSRSITPDDDIVKLLGGDAKAARMIDQAIYDGVSTEAAKELQKIIFQNWKGKDLQAVKELLEKGGVTGNSAKRIMGAFESTLNSPPRAEEVPLPV